MKLTAKKLGILLMFVYFVSYVTRINFGAVIAEMVTATGFSKSQLSIALTGAFVTYGVGQIISGFFSDMIQPKKLVSLGLVITIAMNIVLPFCASPWLMAAVWCINGFAQAFMWPPIVRIMASLLTADEYKRTTVVVSFGAQIGTIVIYLVSPIVITVADWRFAFWFSALFAVAMLPIWNCCCPDVKFELTHKKQQGTSSSGVWKTLFTPLMISIMIAIILQGSLRDGITTWMPSYIAETYKLGNNISILTGVCLPVFSMACFKLTEYVYTKHIKNPLNCAGTVFAIGAASSLLLLVFTGKNAALSVVFIAVLTGCMHGVNLIQTCMIPRYFINTGHISLVSGLLNACTYIGSALSTYGIAVLTENSGWVVTIGVWLVFAAVGALLCFVCVPSWNKKFSVSVSKQ